MLLKFETENYKSFEGRITFLMIPAPKQKGLDYSILNKTIGGKPYKALCSSVIYGPNAAGKTNIIGAMQAFKNIILRGNIKNAEPFNSPNIADYALEVIPNNTLKEKKDVFFSIDFIHEDITVKYSLSMDLGSFMEENYDRSVTEEILEINGKELFRRTKDIVNFNSINSFEKFLITDFVKNSKTATAIARNSLNKTDLFLMNGFRTIVSSRLADLINRYLSNYFYTIYHADTVRTIPIFNTKIAGDALMNEAVSAFGVKANKLVYYKKENDKEPPVLCSIIKNKKDKGIIPAELFESYGTVRFTYMYPLIVKAIKKGATIIIDEFDASIHPMAIMNIINIFHNDEINLNNAQLIFNTHNPLYLNNNLFRRDEIKFVDRDDETMYSKLYSLSDFGTKGTNARKGKDYMNNYFINEYGAIKDIDFTEVFKKIIEEK